MKINGKKYRTIFFDGKNVKIIDQTKLPYSFEIIELKSVYDVAKAIKEMQVRGAGLIGVTAAYGMYLAARAGMKICEAAKILIATRPTASNLRYAVDLQLKHEGSSIVEKTLETAQKLAEEDVQMAKEIGKHGLELIKEFKTPVNIMTHCNAGWLAFVDYGSATSPIYAAAKSGIKVHVWVSETRPRNQGALTAWELKEQGIPHTFVADNASGHLMQKGKVDMLIVGADRVSAYGDVANKIGTYMKALAAKDNLVPFYVAFPNTTIDWKIQTGRDIPIEERDPSEVQYVGGTKVTDSQCANYAFDVTPSRLITGFITEKGVCKPDELGKFK